MTEHRTGEDAGAKPAPLTLWNDPNASSRWLGGFSPSHLPRGERGVWGKAPGG